MKHETTFNKWHHFKLLFWYYATCHFVLITNLLLYAPIINAINNERRAFVRQLIIATCIANTPHANYR